MVFLRAPLVWVTVWGIICGAKKDEELAPSEEPSWLHLIDRSLVIERLFFIGRRIDHIQESLWKSFSHISEIEFQKFDPPKVLKETKSILDSVRRLQNKAGSAIYFVGEHNQVYSRLKFNIQPTEREVLDKLSLLSKQYHFTQSPCRHLSLKLSGDKRSALWLFFASAGQPDVIAYLAKRLDPTHPSTVEKVDLSNDAVKLCKFFRKLSRHPGFNGAYKGWTEPLRFYVEKPRGAPFSGLYAGYTKSSPHFQREQMSITERTQLLQKKYPAGSIFSVYSGPAYESFCMLQTVDVLARKWIANETSTFLNKMRNQWSPHWLGQTMYYHDQGSYHLWMAENADNDWWLHIAPTTCTVKKYEQTASNVQLSTMTAAAARLAFPEAFLKYPSTSERIRSEDRAAWLAAVSDVAKSIREKAKEARYQTQPLGLHTESQSIVLFTSSRSEIKRPSFDLDREAIYHQLTVIAEQVGASNTDLRHKRFNARVFYSIHEASLKMQRAHPSYFAYHGTDYDKYASGIALESADATVLLSHLLAWGRSHDALFINDLGSVFIVALSKTFENDCWVFLPDKASAKICDLWYPKQLLT